MEKLLDKDYFNDKEILSAFHPRPRAKVETLLGAISSVIAYTPEGTLVVHGEPLEGSSIVDLLYYELYNRQPPWMRGAVSSLINCHLNLTAFRARHYRPTKRCAEKACLRHKRRGAKPSATKQVIQPLSVESTGSHDIRDEERRKSF
ncbi:hypothetical protein ISCGN_008042 [Ixodes scapularis]